MKPILIAAGLSLSLALALPAMARQDAEDFTARLNRAPGQAAPAQPAAQPAVQPAAPAPASEPPLLEDLTARLNQIRQNRTDDAPPAPAPEAPTAEAPETHQDPPEETPQEDLAEPAAEAPPAAEPRRLDSQDGLAFRATLPDDFDLIERPSGPSSDVYQVSRDGVPFVGIYVGCCSPFPIYDGRQVVAGARTSIIVPDGDANRAVEHLFVRESDGRQIHVWLHSLDAGDRPIAERIAQSVDPR